MLNDRVIRITFFISISTHILFLGMPGFNPSSFQAKKLQDLSVQIEIEKPSLLPKIDVMGEEKKLKEVVEKQEEPELKAAPELEQIEEIVLEKPQPELPKEIVKVINPQDEAMLRYQDMVKQRIENARKYPPSAKRQGIEGTVYINFVVLSNGLSQDIKIIRSSGSNILDEEAVGTIKRANPFPSVPKEIGAPFVRMEVAIVFALK